MAEEQQQGRLRGPGDDKGAQIFDLQGAKGIDGDEAHDGHRPLPNPLVGTWTGSGIETHNKKGEYEKRGAHAAEKRRMQTGHFYEQVAGRDGGHGSAQIAANQAHGNERLSKLIDQAAAAFPAASRGPRPPPPRWLSAPTLHRPPPTSTSLPPRATHAP